MSFNSLFGLGGNSEDANLEGFWPLQDDAASTAVDDASSNANDGTLTASTTATQSRTGPNSWMSKSLEFGSGQALDLATSIESTEFTMGAWVYEDSSTSSIATLFGHDTDPLSLLCANWSDNNSWGLRNSVSGSPTTEKRTLDNNIGFTEATWHFVAVKGQDVGSSNVKFFRDSSTYTATITTTGTVRTRSIGYRAESSDLYWVGEIAGAFAFSRILADADLDEIRLGPEPVNTAAPVLSGTETEGQTLSCTSGTWGLPSLFISGSNGAISNTYQWTRSNDAAGAGEADISGATASTYTLVAGDVGKFIRCRVRGTNTGGFDSTQDEPSNMSGAISASGGGGLSIPVARHHYTMQLQGAF